MGAGERFQLLHLWLSPSFDPLVCVSLLRSYLASISYLLLKLAPVKDHFKRLRSFRKTQKEQQSFFQRQEIHSPREDVKYPSTNSGKTKTSDLDNSIYGERQHKSRIGHPIHEKFARKNSKY